MCNVVTSAKANLNTTTPAREIVLNMTQRTAAPTGCTLTRELSVRVTRDIGCNDEDPYGTSVSIKLCGDVVVSLGDQHLGRLCPKARVTSKASRALRSPIV